MTAEQASTRWRRVLWAGLFLVIGYWFVWVVACPVLNTDSLTFNLARLWVLERGGLFHNSACTWTRLLTAPLAFDATHYPFLYLGHAYELPSFICFIGLLAASYHLLQERFGGNSGLLACLGLLGMPVMVYQAANTKNDLVVAFGLMVWFYAMDRARREGERSSRMHLVMAALALGLITGSKASGAAFGVIGGCVSFVILRGAGQRRLMLEFGGALAVSALLFSDWEIYVANHMRFGNWLGEPADVSAHVNTDGLRGIGANLLRYLCDLTDPLLLGPSARSAFIRWKNDVVESCLKHLGLVDLGMMHMPWRALNENNFSHPTAEVYTENNATYGLLGMLVAWGTPLALAWRRRWDLIAQLFTVASISFALVAFTIGWSPTNLRYLVAPFAFGWCGLAAWVSASGRPRFRTMLAALALLCTVVTAVVAVSKPANRFFSVLHAPRELLNQQHLALVTELDALVAGGELPVVLYSAPRTDLFDVYDRLRSGVIVEFELDAPTFATLDEQFHRGRYIVLAMSRDVPAAPNFQPIQRFSGRRSAADAQLFLWSVPR